MLKLVKCEFWKLRRKKFVQLVLAASFLFPVPLTVMFVYLNNTTGKYESKAAAFDSMWQSVLGFGMDMLLPCILGIVAALLFFMERDNGTFKNLRTVPVTSTEMVLAKLFVLLILSVLFCVSSTLATIICGNIFFEATGVIYKLCFSIIMGVLLALSSFPLVVLIVFFSKSYIFSILLCVFYSVFNLLATFAIGVMPKALTFILPTPSIMLWSSSEMASHMAISDAEDLKNFTELGLIPSTFQLFLTIGVIALLSVWIIVNLYKRRGE